MLHILAFQIVILDINFITWSTAKTAPNELLTLDLEKKLAKHSYDVYTCHWLLSGEIIHVSSW